MLPVTLRVTERHHQFWHLMDTMAALCFQDANKKMKEYKEIILDKNRQVLSIQQAEKRKEERIHKLELQHERVSHELMQAPGRASCRTALDCLSLVQSSVHDA